MSEEVINLPSRFEQLEYLESTGSQYIDIDYIPTNTTGFWVDAEQITHSNGVPVGSGCDRNSPADAMMPPRWLKSTNNSAGFGWGGWSSWGNISNGGRFISKLNFCNDKKAYLETLGDNPQQLSRDLGELSFTPTKSTLFFKTSVNPGVADYNWYGRIYEVKITQDTEIIRDFIPAYDKVLEKPCMFDLVTQTSYYNQGSGEFLYYHEEPIISIPYGYKRCIFLESTGTQYIDTQIAATSSHGLWADVLGTSSEDRNIFGCSHIETVDGVEQITSLSLPKNNSTHSYYYGLSQGNFTEDSTYYNKRYTKFINYLNLKLAGLQKLNTANTSALVDEEFELESNIFLFTNNETIRNEDGTISSTIGAAVNGEINPNTFIGKIYRAKITYEENIIADFIPCLDDKGKPCMYDLISQTPFYNANAEGTDFKYVVKGKIPSWYKRIEYLESTATSGFGIDTGIKGSNSVEFSIKFNCLYSGTGCILGSRISSARNEIQVSSHNNGIFRMGNNNYNIPFSINAIHEASLVDGKYILDDTVTTVDVGNWKNDFNIHLFVLNESNNLTQGSRSKIYFCKLYENKELVRDFVPCLDDNGIPCMYDLVEGIPYYNIGSGEFLYNKGLEGSYTGFGQLSGIGNRLGGGTDGLPPTYTRVNYLESTGIENIKLPTPNLYETHELFTVVTDCQFLSENKTRMGFIARGGLSWGTDYTNDRNGRLVAGASGSPFLLDVFGRNRNVVTYSTTYYLTADGTPHPADTPTGNTTWTQTISVGDKKSGGANGNGKLPDTWDYGVFLVSYEATTVSYPVRIWSCKCWCDSVSYDLIPCLDDNGRPCMFDRVSRTSFYNSGTGEFLYG